jgi:CHAD domain-containing protein
MAYRFAVAPVKTSRVNPAVLNTRLLALLERIPNRAGKEDVHRLRTTVRRLEAQLADPPAHIAKSLKTLRRKAGKVRDIDVHLALLKPSLLPLPPIRTHPGPGLPDASLRRAQQELRRILKASRARRLVSLRRRVSEAAPLLAAGLPALAANAGRGQLSAAGAHQRTALARRQFLQWTHTVPADAGRLHRLRIRTKKLRYSLEPLERHQEAAELAARFKQVQDAIGTWHDWATLQQLAGSALSAPHAALLQAALRARAASQFRQARHVVQSVRSALTGHKPVASETGENLPQRLIRKAG